MSNSAKLRIILAVIAVIPMIAVALIQVLGALEQSRIPIRATQTAAALSALSASATPPPAQAATIPPSDSATSPDPTLEAVAAPAQVTAPEPQTSLPALTFKDGCIFASTWQATSQESGSQANTPEEDGCLSLSAEGIAVDNSGVLHIIQTAKKGAFAAGIYTPIKDKARVEFNLFVNNFYVAYPDKPAAINFAIAPRENPLKNITSARFKLLVDVPIKMPLIFFALADLGETNGSKIASQHYEYGRTYAIKLELDGAEMKASINGKPMSDHLALPPGEKVFLIGYDLSARAGADIEISDIRVDGVSK